MSYLKEDKDIFFEPSFISTKLYNKLLDANNNFLFLRKYIYNNFFLDLLEYENIDEISIKEFIKRNYKKYKFEDSNFFSRWDYFLTEAGKIQISEINNDTPFWFVESFFLNEKDIKWTINPNKNLMTTFLTKLKKYWVNNLYVAWDMSYTEENRLSLFLKDFFSYHWLNSYNDWFWNLTIKDDGVFYWWKKIDTVLKLIPIDWLYEDFDMEKIEKLQEKWYVKLINNQFSFPFQIKSFYSYLWKYIDKFDENIQNIIKEHIPYTLRFDEIKKIDNINKDDWVIKHINIREWVWVYIWKETDQKTWDSLLENNKNSQNWILQKDFNSFYDKNGITYNYWIYNIQWEYAGIFFRMHKKRKTDINSISTGLYVTQ